MILKTILSCLILFTVFSLTAQEEDVKLNREVDFGLNSGFEAQYYNLISAYEWNKLTPGYLNGDEIDPNYENDFYYLTGLNSASGFSLAVNLHKLDAPKQYFSNFIRFTFSSGQGFNAETSWTQSSSVHSDTLTSSSTGAVLYVDSFYSKSYSKSYASRQSQFSFAHIWQTNREKRFSFYVGLGFGFGLSNNSRATVKESLDSRATISNNSGLVTQAGGALGSETLINKRFPLKNYSSLQLYAPIGFDMKLSKKSTFLGHFILSAEMGFGYNWVFMKEISTLKNHSFRMQFSVKYRF